RLEDGDDRRARPSGRLEVALNELDVGIDDGELPVREAAEEVAGARGFVVQERAKDHYPALRLRRSLSARQAASVLPVLELPLFLLDVVPEYRMQRQVGGVAACRDGPTEALSHRTDVVRSRTAADADVVHTQVSGRRSELAHLEARAEERIECERQ